MMRFVYIKKHPPRSKTHLTSMADLGSRETRKTDWGGQAAGRQYSPVVKGLSLGMTVPHGRGHTPQHLCDLGHVASHTNLSVLLCGVGMVMVDTKLRLVWGGSQEFGYQRLKMGTLCPPKKAP